MDLSLTKRRAFFLLLTGIFILSIESFYNHLRFFLSGQVAFFMKQDAWLLVFGSVVFFLLFLLPLKFRRKADWRSSGIYAAFLISLFVEMYGLPLTVYLSSAFISLPSSSQIPGFIFGFAGFQVNIWMLAGLLITGIGALTVALGWHQVYTAKGVARNGIYRFSRHPQYLGIILISVGWFVGWPTPLTALLLPVVVFEYYRLSKEEETEALEEFGEDYRNYMESTPRFI